MAGLEPPSQLSFKMTSFARHRLRLTLGTAALLSFLLLAGCGEDAPGEAVPSSGGAPAAGRASVGGDASAGAAATASTGGTMASAGGSPGAGNGGTSSSGLAGLAGMSTEGGASNGGSTGASGMGGTSLGGENNGGMAGTSSTGGAGAPAGGASSQQPTTIWVAGDSTVMTYEAGNTKGNNGTSLEGWGQELGAFFNDHVSIDNQAIGGRSVAFFMWAVATDSSGAFECTDDQGTPKFRLNNGSKVDTSQWAKIKAGMKAGDFLLIQFGHNDETHTCPRFVSTTDYATYLGFMADTAIAHGATPVFVTPMGHRTFTGTKFNNTLLPYAQSMKAEAQLKDLEVIDLNLRSGEYYEKVGNAFLTTNIFDGGTTHFVKAGAVEMASLIAGEIKKQGGRLATYLK